MLFSDIYEQCIRLRWVFTMLKKIEIIAACEMQFVICFFNARNIKLLMLKFSTKFIMFMDGTIFPMSMEMEASFYEGYENLYVDELRERSSFLNNELACAVEEKTRE